MTVLDYDHSEDWPANVRMLVTAHLAEPGRVPAVGVPKSRELPATLRVETAEHELDVAEAAAHARACHLKRLIDTDARVQIRQFEIVAKVGDEYTERVELLPWLG